MTFTPDLLTDLAYFFTNTDRKALELAGIIQPGKSGDEKWERFNHNFDIFILKSDEKQLEALANLANAYVGQTTPPPPSQMVAGKFSIGDRVRKTKGSSWNGRIVGFYSTELTPIGYAVESEREPGSVQIYPEAALSAPEAEG